MGRLYRIVKTLFDVLRKAPGKAIVIQVEAENGESREIEFYQLPGFAAGPTPKDRAATVNLQGYRVAVASHNYRIEVEAASGQTILYSTNSAGDTVKAKINMQADGKIGVTADSDINLEDGGGNTVAMSGSSVVVNGNLEVLQ